MKTKLLNKLSIKLILTLSFLLIIILAIYTYVDISSLENYLTKIKLANANNISDVIKKSTRYSMLLNRREDVYQIINTVGTEKGVDGIRIYNKQGTIIYSTDSAEIFTKVDLDAEACYACHSQSTPLKRLSTQNKMRLFQTEKGNKILGLINPIENEPDCYSADCHAHSPDTDILGVLDVMISMDDLEAAIAENTNNSITNAIIITIIISFFSGLFITVLINKPLNKLTKGIEEVGKGNLSYKIKVGSRDELGRVALQFNEMSDKLDNAYKEIKDWSENLNKKVHEKSEELKNIYNQVMQIEKLASLGKLSATVAHELNNPLEGILTYSKLISKKLKSMEQNGTHEKVLSYLDLISGESARCGKIVKDLLLFSHRGDDEFIKEDIISILDKSITLIKHHLKINGVGLNKNYSSEKAEVSCDSQKLQQAFMALLINAIEAMHDGGEITVSVDVENEFVIIRITDTGTGIADKDLPHIFEPFYSTKEAAKGTGLGLAVTYGIITQHNGSIRVEKSSSEGTTFKINLPFVTTFTGKENEPEKPNINS